MIYKYENQIILGDCIEIMKRFEDKSIDLVLTDPPYGINVSGKIGGGSDRGESKDFGVVDWDNEIPSKEYFKEMFRISKNQIIFGGNYFIENLFNTRCMLIWYKRDGLPDRTFADCEIAWTSFDNNSKVYNIRHDGFIRDSKDIKYHPTQKPTELFKRIIVDFSNEGDLILDPFIGSGTTAISCHDLKRRFVGIEKNENYYHKAVNRYEKHKEQLFLF